MIFVIFETIRKQTMKTDRQQTGRRGEDEACDFLRSRGHFILARNWRAGHLELDIVSVLGSEVHFVEVKSRTEPVTADPIVNVNALKQKRIVRAASTFMNSRCRLQLPPDAEVCFDIITIVFNNSSTRIEYYPRAFIPIYV